MPQNKFTHKLFYHLPKKAVRCRAVFFVLPCYFLTTAARRESCVLGALSSDVTVLAATVIKYPKQRLLGYCVRFSQGGKTAALMVLCIFFLVGFAAAVYNFYDAARLVVFCRLLRRVFTPRFGAAVCKPKNLRFDVAFYR